MNSINKIACSNNMDTSHRIHFFRDGAIQSMTLAELDHQAASLAVHLQSLGLARGDRIGVMAKNCIEWVLMDLAVLKIGGVLAGFEMGRYEANTLSARYGLKLLLLDKVIDNADSFVMSVADVRLWAEKGATSATALHVGYQDNDIAAIKFTSGSTGDPKGLEATVGSINDSLQSVQSMFLHCSTDNILVFLPLSLLQQRYWVYSALIYGHDVSITNLDFCFLIAQTVKPTVVMGVPGFFDTVKTQIERVSAADTINLDERREGIQGLLGGNIRYLWTGSAPCSLATLNYFNQCGVPLFEGYGMNETCIVAKNYPGSYRIGSVGKVLPNKTVRFNEEGVLIVGSHHPVNTHYSWCNPGDNEKMFLPSGDVLTGDLGYLDDDNFLYILGRADDVLALSNGRKVNVRAIEESIKLHADIHDCVLFGSGKPFLTALISPAATNMQKSMIEEHIQTVNQQLSKDAQIGGFYIAPERFAIENNLLTSQFKPKRKEIFRRYAVEIEDLYLVSQPPVGERYHITGQKPLIRPTGTFSPSTGRRGE